MKVVGYQTLEDKDNIDEVEMDGPFLCNHRHAWLGTGSYLWDTNMQWAKDWGQFAYEKYDKDFIIGRCDLLIDEDCFDLVGNIAHRLELIDTIEAIVESGYLSEDRITVPKVIEFLKRQGEFDFKCIRAEDYPGRPNRLAFRINFNNGRAQVQEYMLLNQRVQICVINKKDVILSPFLVIYPENYLN